MLRVGINLFFRMEEAGNLWNMFSVIFGELFIIRPATMLINQHIPQILQPLQF